MPETSLKVATINLFGEQPPFEDRMALLSSGLRELDPDVVALQEVRQVEGFVPNQAKTLGEACGYQWVFVAATPWGGGQEGLGMLSRYPILSHESLVLPASTPDETRLVLMVSVGTPTGPVNCYSTHLHYRVTHGIEREQQVLALDDFVRAHPSEAPQILMGDFNASPENDEIRFMRGRTTLDRRRTYYQDAFALCNPADPGATWAKRNPLTEKFAWLERDRRIDYIFVTPAARDGRGTVEECRVVLDKPDARGTYPSDHFGLWARIRISGSIAA